MNVVINEIFYSIQGEGRFAGQPSVFVRLAGCNLRCDFCDTTYAQSPHSGTKISLENVIEKIKSYNCPNLVITGGEPMVNPQLEGLVEMASTLFETITIETNGTCFKEFASISNSILMSISPKFADRQESGFKHGFQIQSQTALISPETVLELLSRYNHQLKFVVGNDTDIGKIQQVIQSLGSVCVRDVFLMPEAKNRHEYLRESRRVAELCLEYGYNFSPRHHIMIWDTERGV